MACKWFPRHVNKPFHSSQSLQVEHSAIPWGFLEGAARARRGYVVLSSHSRSVAQEEEIQQCFLGGLVIHATYLFSYTVPSLSEPALDKFDSQIQLVLAFLIKAPWRRTGSMDGDRA